MKCQPFAHYTEALEWIHGLLRFGQKPGLERMKWMLEVLHHPERHVPFVHIAGTNGKGSTCAFLTHMLIEAGYSVGSFTSPYLHDFRERICYNRQMIAEKDFLQLANQVKPLVEQCAESTPYGSPTEFEVVTLIAILYFATVRRPAVVVWETGLGGRLDSTNVVHPLVSVITNVGTDHTDVLGTKPEQIASEKAGIIKPGVPVVVGEMSDQAFAVVEEIARSKRSPVYRLGQQFEVRLQETSRSLDGMRFCFNSLLRRDGKEYGLRVLGDHQAVNAATALMTVDLLKEFYAFLLEEEEIERGLRQTRWPGRLEVVSRRPLFILDGAHNVEGMEALAKTMRQLVGAQPIELLFAALADKPLVDMVKAWKRCGPAVSRFYLTTFDFPRAASIEQLVDAFHAEYGPEQITVIDDWPSFIRSWLRAEEQREQVLLTCGSLYFISQVRAGLPTSVEEAGE
ncbi:bifunctional folylpolyglutamate synthase/dihydrofolate synthase [Brevibacillus humidisoli]|uniref:bifunctional folylpolyglutamate synthase/dihydrofolate synthase n=1 Tax=Brevibacillus humidisoli TaxID=2895522 RepID=UPI001E304F47|nr:folylpolyglutamate synthase/dihydrofolate synthase family protein [Brevibacillus humidisoli]UFJ39061.1 bifunctional folylpolyglutamate synthase/dihydrofolate synthase [Brevibacillus humidisoli]